MKTVTAIFIALVLSAPAAAQVSLKQRECVYDYTMLSPHECRSYRMKVLKARSAEERIVLQEELNQVMAERARARGVAENDWRGLALTPVRSAAR